MSHRSLFLAIALALFARPGLSHEFWIEPDAYAVSPDAEVTANLLVGQDFAGNRVPYYPQRFARFEVRMGDEVLPVEGRLGDIPAMSQALPGDGLAVIVHQTKGDSLQYASRELFDQFLDHKDMDWVREAHVARGLPELQFREAYTRYVKALVAIGDGAGADGEVGLKTEIVALANPYTDDLSGGFPVRLLADGAPRADAQVELWSKAGGAELEHTFHRTDANGEVTLPVTPGRAYMVDAVLMEDTGNDDPGEGPVWHSHWAALTFMAPAQE